MLVNNKNKIRHRDIVFPQEAGDRIGEIIQKYRLKEPWTQISKKIKAGKNNVAPLILARLTKHIALNIVSEDEASLTIKQELKLGKQKAKEIAREIADIALLAKTDDTLKKWPVEAIKAKTLTPNKLKNSGKQDSYREPIE